ncbi:hypothetical protein FSB40_004718 [Escherichia coli]|nr:hypothetical protein [Escherichia coli]HDU6786500.1 hypothetical protein [Escherichia coli]
MGTDAADVVAARNSRNSRNDYGRGSYSSAGGCAVFCCPGWLSAWWWGFIVLVCMLPGGVRVFPAGVGSRCAAASCRCLCVNVRVIH